MDDALVVIQIISMLAAVGAIVLAHQTVLESRALRREERVARLPDLIVNVASAGPGIDMDLAGSAEALWVAQARLRAGLRAVGEPLPACERVLSAQWVGTGYHPRALDINADAHNAVIQALDEVGAALMRVGGEGSTVVP